MSAARMVGIGLSFAAEPEVDADIESTLVFASLAGMDEDDLRVLSVLTTWLGVHHAHVNADRLVRLVGEQPSERVRAYWASIASWLHKDRRLARLSALHDGPPVELLPTGSEFQIQRRGEDPRFVGSKLRAPSGTLRDRAADVLAPDALVRRHAGYRNRVHGALVPRRRVDRSREEPRPVGGRRRASGGLLLRNGVAGRPGLPAASRSGRDVSRHFVGGGAPCHRPRYDRLGVELNADPRWDDHLDAGGGNDMIDTRQRLALPDGTTRTYCSLPELERRGVARVARLPVSLRIMLESVVRHLDGRRIRDEDVEALTSWQPGAARTAEVPFVVGRVLLQDFTGVPLLVDLAAMREAVARRGGDPALIEPRVPVDLVVDHSVQVDHFGTSQALELNTAMELHRNAERYRFLKWGAEAFEGLRIVPPGFGICHQVNLEFLARGVLERGGTLFPDSLVGTDSHTPMINGLGVIGWGVGGIEAEAAMLGQPVFLLLPDVVGVHLGGRLRAGVTATDLVLHITELLRRAGVVGKFVEFHGEGAASLSVPDRATLANMAPEYGATIGLFPVDDVSCRYLLATGRSEAHVEIVRRYHQAQGLFGMPSRGQCDYTMVIDVDLAAVEPSVAGPRRPQDRIALGQLKSRFVGLLTSPGPDGFGKPVGEIARRVEVRLGEAVAPRPGGGAQAAETVPHGGARNTSTLTEIEMMDNRPTPNRPGEADPGPEPTRSELAHGDVVIAAITSCTNTSNPAVMLAAGLLARKAVERGLTVKPWVKTSLAPGSRVVSAYLARTGLQPFLDRLGFQLVGFGCTTCIGNSGPLDHGLEAAILDKDLVAVSALSGNRNFEARIHQSVKANFLMSPPLVVAFAIAGRIDIDLEREPLGVEGGRETYLRDVWPAPEEVAELLSAAFDPEEYRRVYAGFADQNPMWSQIPAPTGQRYAWDPASNYIREPPYFDASMALAPASEVTGARALAIFGDSITTDHISPAGAIQPASPAGEYLRGRGVAAQDFNSYGARRGDHEVMVRGTFANVRIKNAMLPGVEGGLTIHQPDGERMGIYAAAERYRAEGVPLVVLAGQDYGAGSSRDWAAKGTRLLGVRAVIARSFERIHRSNLIGMGVFPCQFLEGVSAGSLGLDGSERFTLELGASLRPKQTVTLHIDRGSRQRDTVPLVLRIDTPIEVAYFSAGGILPHVLEELLAPARGPDG